jgi:hypothetical protein
VLTVVGGELDDESGIANKRIEYGRLVRSVHLYSILFTTCVARVRVI